jgi:chemotaxis protein histidine kinase CheA
MQSSRYTPQTLAAQQTAHRLLDNPLAVEKFLQHLPSRNRPAPSIANGNKPATSNPEQEVVSPIRDRRETFKAAVHEKAALVLEQSPGKLLQKHSSSLCFGPCSVEGQIPRQQLTDALSPPFTVVDCASPNSLTNVSNILLASVGSCQMPSIPDSPSYTPPTSESEIYTFKSSSLTQTPWVALSSNPQLVDSAVKENPLPVSALPFTLRSSSLPRSSTQSSPDMAGSGLYASRYASVNPLGSAQARQTTIKDRLAQLKSMKPSLKEQAAQQAAARLAFEEAEARRLEEEEKEKKKEEEAAAEVKSAAEAAAEARHVEAERAAKEKEAAVVKARRIAEEEEEARQLEAESVATARITESRLEIDQFTTKLGEVKKAEEARKKAREKAGMAALEELSLADARFKEATKDKAEVSKLVETTTAELVVVQKRLHSLEKKREEVDEVIFEAQKNVDSTNQKINAMEATHKTMRAIYEKERNELVKKIELLQQLLVTEASVKVIAHLLCFCTSLDC